MNSEIQKKTTQNSATTFDVEVSRDRQDSVVKPNKKHLALLRKSLATSPESVTADLWQEWYESTPWNEWRRAHPRARPNLSGVNLEGLALPIGDLSNVQFFRSNLSYSSLGDLHKSDLGECNLERADLIDAFLDDCYFVSANLHRADLSDSSASLADFSHANLQGAILCDSEMFGACFLFADLRGAHLAGGWFIGSDFESANLQGVDAIYANFQSCDFTEANLKGVDFRNCDLQDAKFDGALIDKKTKIPKEWRALVEKAAKG